MTSTCLDSESLGDRSNGWRGSVVSRRARQVAMFGLIAMLVTGCSVVSSGSPSLDQLSLEQRYESTYHQQMTLLLADLMPYQASAQSPGACDKGSSRSTCYEADVRTRGQ